MTRENLIALCLSASTDEEIDFAEQKLDEYIREHPDDFDILSCGESLEMTRTYPRVKELATTSR